MQTINTNEATAIAMRQHEKTGVSVAIPGLDGLWLINAVVVDDEFLSTVFAEPAAEAKR